MWILLPFFFPNMLSAAFLTSSTIITNIDVVRDSVSIVAMDYRKRLLQTIRIEQRLDELSDVLVDAFLSIEFSELM